jgi:predicted glycosyltransferase
MPKEQRRNIFRRARRLGVRTYHFYRQMEKLLAAADLVISMGGYNTICEILSQKTVSLVIPREAPRREQLLRAQAMAGRHLVDYIPWAQLSPQTMRRKVQSLLDTPQQCLKAVYSFRLTGIDVMCQRLMGFRDLVC